MDKRKSYIHDGSTNCVLVEIAYFGKKKQSKVPYVQNESTEIICIGKIISKSEAK